MNVKFKLALSFAVGGLMLMLLVEHGFSYVISSGQHHRDASLLHHYAKKFSSDLPSYYARPESIAQLQAAVANLGAGQLSAILLDKSARVIAVGPPHLALDHTANLAQQIGVKALGSSEGNMDMSATPVMFGQRLRWPVYRTRWHCCTRPNALVERWPRGR